VLQPELNRALVEMDAGTVFENCARGEDKDRVLGFGLATLLLAARKLLLLMKLGWHA